MHETKENYLKRNRDFDEVLSKLKGARVILWFTVEHKSFGQNTKSKDKPI